MTEQWTDKLGARELATLADAFHAGSAEASQALAKWIGKPSAIEIDSLEQMPLRVATGMLATGDAPLCFSTAEIEGPLSGEMILACDDASGLALSDMLLDLPAGSTAEWSEIAISAALETANILFCAYLNALAAILSVSGKAVTLLPTPPKFSRDFAESLLQFALMGQAVAGDVVLVARTRFEIDGAEVAWSLLFVPDADSMMRLTTMLAGDETGQGGC